MKIRIAGTEISLQYQSFEIYVQGCNRHCKGCHNPETWDFDGGEEEDAEDFLEVAKEYINLFKSVVSRIYVTGGDLLCLPRETAIEFSRLVREKFPGYELWLFTGCHPDFLPNWVWDYYDVVKAGEYKEEYRLPDGSFPITSNQKILFNKRGVVRGSKN